MPTNELTNIMNQSLVMPFLFIVLCIAVFVMIVVVIYAMFLSKWVPEILVRLVAGLGALGILFLCSEHYEAIKKIVANWTTIGLVIGFIVFCLITAIIGNMLPNNKRRRTKRAARPVARQTRRPAAVPRKATTQRSYSSVPRSDHEILSLTFEQLSGMEFERLLALYFQDNGYTVKEVGVGGNDGGVDLVITDHRGEKTAVQAKCYADSNTVGVQVVRELVAAKRNHDCILSLLITTSDLTAPAKYEAEKFKVDYWHGAVIEQKLRSWGKWTPGVKQKSVSNPVRPVATNTVSSSDIPSTANITKITNDMNVQQTTPTQTAAARSIICSCGSQMVLRKNKEGAGFYGCSAFPKCRKTQSV